MTDDLIRANAETYLRSYIKCIERLVEEKAALAADICKVYAEAKGHGFDAKVMRQVIRLRKMDREERQTMEQLVDLYMATLEKAP